MAEVKDGGGTLYRKAGLVSSLTAVSRVLGLVREQVFAALLGAGLYADAFQIAFRIPNLLRDLFAEGALSAAFVPTYAKVRAEQGQQAADRLASRLLSVLAVVLTGLVALAVLFAPVLVGALAPGFEKTAGKAEATVLMTRIMLPFLPLVSFAAVAMGMLNAQGRFGPPAFAPAMFNVVAVVWAGGLWLLGLGPRTVAIGWAVGTLLGGLAQFVIQLPPLFRLGWRYRPEWAPADPALRSMAALMAPATFGLAAVQLNIFISSSFASHEPSAVSWLQYAFRILYLPIGIFGVAVGTVATSGLSRQAAGGDLDGMRATLRQSLRMLLFLTVPSMAGILALGVPVVRLLYERGAFGPRDTDGTAVALAYYSLGLFAYSAVKVLAPAFYAFGSPRVPVLSSAAAVATNVVVIAALYSRMGFRAVALGTALGSVVNALVLALALHRKLAVFRDSGLLRPVAKVLAASVPMAALAWASARVLEARVGTAGLPAQLVTGLGPVVVGAAFYFAATRVLRLEEAVLLTRAVARRLGRRGA